MKSWLQSWATRPRRSGSVVGVGRSPTGRRDRADRRPVLAVPDLEQALRRERLTARSLRAERHQIAGVRTDWTPFSRTIKGVWLLRHSWLKRIPDAANRS